MVLAPCDFGKFMTMQLPLLQHLSWHLSETVPRYRGLLLSRSTAKLQ